MHSLFNHFFLFHKTNTVIARLTPLENSSRKTAVGIFILMPFCTEQSYQQ